MSNLTTILTLDFDGVHIVDAETAEKLENKKLSASMVTGIEQCPAKWLFSTYVLPFLDTVPMNAAVRGSAFHQIMEDFFGLEPGERTSSNLRAIIKKVVYESEYAEFFTDYPEEKKWLSDALRGYNDLGEKPSDVKIAEIRGEKGLEVFIEGSVGSSSRPVIGFIDRVLQGDDGVIVEDWKTAAKAKEWYPGIRYNEGWNEVRQQTIYAMILEQNGVAVEDARLIFPVARKVVHVPLTDEVKKKVVADVEKADMKVSTMIESNTFEYGPSPLCSWCPLVHSCPAAWTKSMKPNAVEARAQQPKYIPGIMRL